MTTHNDNPATPTDPLYHTAPLRWLVATKLHPGRTLRDNVLRLRKRRRRASVVASTDLDLSGVELK